MASVGRKRKRDGHLPRRMYFKHGAYYFVPRSGSWVLLGRDYPSALRAYAKILGADAPATTIELLVARYETEELAGKAKKTQAGRRQEFKPIVKAFGPMDPEAIEPHHVWNFFQARGKTEQARHEVRAFSALLTFARRIGARKQPNPCFGLQLPGSKRRTRYVTDDEFLIVRDLAQPMIGYAMDLALVAGMDEATIRTLERKHWSAEGFKFERAKTASRVDNAWQLVDWSEELDMIVKGILRERPQLRRVLICNRKGQAYSANGFQSQWQRTMRKALKAGLKESFHFHDLRAKSASDADTDKEAADRLGHGDEAITRKTYRRLPRRSTPLKILDK